MSRLFEALKQSEVERGEAVAVAGTNSAAVTAEPAKTPAHVLQNAEKQFSELEQATSLSPVATPDLRLIALTDELSLGAEKFRVAATMLTNLQEVRPNLKRVVLTSSAPLDGKTTVATNLAVTLAKRTKKKVLLLGGDMRKPEMSKLLGMAGLPGLGEWHSAVNRPISKFLYRLDGLPLWVLPAGKLSCQPLDILQSPRTAELLGQLGAWFDWVLVDTPPVLPMADTKIWIRLCDGALLVVRKDMTEKKFLEETTENLDAAKLIGVIVNAAAPVHEKLYRRYHPKNGSKAGN